MTLTEFQAFIDRLSSSFVTGDITLWRGAVRLPLSRVTKDGIIEARSEEDFRADFEAYRATFAREAVTQIRREVKSVEMLDADQALATYDTEILRGHEVLFEPYTSSMMLLRVDAEWKCIAVMNALSTTPKRAAPGTTPMERTPEVAKAIYQEHLDQVSRAMISGTFDAIARHVRLPCLMGTLDAETTFHKMEPLLNTLRHFVENLRRLGMTDYIRICNEAQFTTATRIEGWHVTHVLTSGSHMVTPYKCEGVLELTEGVWCMTVGRSHVMNHINGLIPAENTNLPMPLPDVTPQPSQTGLPDTPSKGADQ